MSTVQSAPALVPIREALPLLSDDTGLVLLESYSYSTSHLPKKVWHRPILIAHYERYARVRVSTASYSLPILTSWQSCGISGASTTFPKISPTLPIPIFFVWAAQGYSRDENGEGAGMTKRRGRWRRQGRDRRARRLSRDAERARYALSLQERNRESKTKPFARFVVRHSAKVPGVPG